MRLGTITRNYHRDDEIDIDLVARRDQPKQSISQASSRRTPALAWRSSCSANRREPRLSTRASAAGPCTTPASTWTCFRHCPTRTPTSSSAIIITDTELVRWQFSNPIAYADWFHKVMAEEIDDKLKVVAKRMDIAQVPDWQVKTTLQQTVQALKRHRDIYFTDALDLRPASIIITTLAAHAYRGSGGDLYEVLDDITDRMPSFVRHDGQRYIVANPVEPRENFADRWHGKPERAEAFFRWIEQAKTDFDGLARTGGGLDTVISKMASVLGDRPAQEAGRSLSRGIVESRRQGQLSYGAGTGTLAAAAAAGTRRVTRDHDFHGHNGARP